MKLTTLGKEGNILGQDAGLQGELLELLQQIRSEVHGTA